MNYTVEVLGKLFHTVDDEVTRKHIAHAIKRQITLCTQDAVGVSPRPDRITPQERKLYKNGNCIAAIKALRERTGLGLGEAIELLDK